MIYRRLLAFFLSFALIFSSTSALAASPAGWSASVADTVMAGATATITALKGSGSTAMKAVVSHKPTAVAVGKELIKGGGVLALAYAASQLLGAGVDYVLDPANNSIKYVSGTAETGSATVAGYSWTVNNVSPAIKLSSPAAVAAELELRAFGGSDFVSGKRTSFTRIGSTSYNLFLEIVRTGGTYKPGYDIVRVSDASQIQTSSGSNEKAIPIADVAAQVVANAEAGHAESQEFIKAVAVGAANAGDLDTSFDAAAVPDTAVDAPADPDAPPVDPTKPFDPSGILDALKKILAALGLLSLLGTISDSLTAMLEWFKGEPEGKPEDNKIDIPEPPLPDIDSTISFGGACPADLGADFNLYGTNFNFVLMPFSKLCPLLSTFVKPTLILLGSFMAVAIVGGRKDA